MMKPQYKKIINNFYDNLNKYHIRNHIYMKILLLLRMFAYVIILAITYIKKYIYFLFLSYKYKSWELLLIYAQIITKSIFVPFGNIYL